MATFTSLNGYEVEDTRAREDLSTSVVQINARIDTEVEEINSSIEGINEDITEINSRIYNEEAYAVELIENPNYSIVGNGIKEYIRNGVGTISFGAIRVITTTTAWTHCATLKSQPLIELYINLIPWGNGASLDCKIDTDGKVWFRAGTPTNSNGAGIHYYGLVTIS